MRRYRYVIFLFLSLVNFLNADKLVLGIHQPVSSYSHASKKDFAIAIHVFLKEIADNTSVPFEVINYDDPEKLAYDFHTKKVNFAIAEPLSFVKYFDAKQLSSGFMGYKKERETSQMVVILGHKNDKRSFKERLKGTIAFNGDPSIDLFVNLLRLENALLVPLHKEPPTKGDHQAILQLFFKKTDLVVVDFTSFQLAYELNPQIKEDLVILERSPLTLQTIAFLHKDISPHLRDTIMKSALNLDQLARGEQLLQLFKATKVDLTYPEDLESLRALHVKYTTLLKNTSPKGK